MKPNNEAELEHIRQIYKGPKLKRLSPEEAKALLLLDADNSDPELQSLIQSLDSPHVP